MVKFLRNLILTCFLFATVPSMQGCIEEQKAQASQEGQNLVLITKKDVYPKNDRSVTLYMDPCDSKKVIELIGPEIAKESSKAKGMIKGEFFEMCYIVDFEEGIIYVIDENGLTGRLPIKAFEPITQVKN